MRIKAMFPVALIALAMWLPAAFAAPSLDAQLRSLSGNVGIWFFYLSTCPYCAQEEPVLHRISTHYDIPVTAISLDGGPTPTRIFKHYQDDRGQAAQLGVTVTPTLYLVHPATRQAVKLTEGYQPGGELVRRIVYAANAAGWLSAAHGETGAGDKVAARTERPPAGLPPSHTNNTADSLTNRILDRLHARRAW